MQIYMIKFRHIQEIGIGEPCRKCNRATVIRTKRGAIKPKSYYSQWEYCKKCEAVYFNEKYKINGK